MSALTPPRRHGLLADLLVLVPALALGGCDGGQAAAPRWIPLARTFRPRPLLELARSWQLEAGLDPESCQEREWNVRVEHPLPRAVWQRGTEGDTWTATLPGGAFAHGSPGYLVLHSDTQPVRMVQGGAELAENSCLVARGQLVLRLARGAEPPVDALLTLRLEDGRLASDDTWQVRMGDEFGAGISVWSGLSEELACALPASSRLAFEARFATCFDGPVTLRVRLDGEPVFETSEDSRRLATEGRWCSFPLPPRARADACLSFEVEGPPGQALFLYPSVGPAELGSPRARPWPGARPDIVLLLADTFRADGLALSGGAHELAPALNAFAEQALRFRSAHSNASWTLPSIGALLSGLAPGQHTANSAENALPGELDTIVEALSRTGYRTGAVTDAAFFAPTFGLDQGFESFVMNPSVHWDLDWTVRQALEFLERDDGRPLFLLVHSYRAHMPFRVGPDEDLAPWNELMAAGCSLLKDKGRIPRVEWRERLARCRERYTELYRAGVRDLDRGFGTLLSELDRRGLWNGYVIFTSDHGEALGENDDLFHDGKLWEAKLQIPLLVRGPGLVPRDIEPVVTLLDLAPTLAEIAGLAPDARWSGASLLGVTEERPACAFLLKKETQVSVLHAGRKLYSADLGAFERGGFDAAYDLQGDPLEEHPVTDEAWPSALALRHAALVRELLRPASPAVKVPLSGAQQRELDQLGYGGDEQD